MCRWFGHRSGYRLGMTTSTLPRFEISLLRVVVGYRAIATVWLLILVAIELREDPLRPDLVVVAAVAVVVWTGLTMAISYRRHRWLSTWTAVIVDVVFAGLLLFVPDWAGSSNFYGGYPISALLLGIYSKGLWGAVLATIVLTGGALARAIADRLPGDATSISGAILVFPFVAAPATWGIGVLRRADRLRREAEDSLAEERAERVRAQERAEMASHLHDSVLQTLALIQRSADQPGEVTTLARRQERELRSWLYGEDEAHDESLAGAMRTMTAEIEEQYRVNVQLVMVGDTSISDRRAALLAACREAIVNAAKHSGADVVDVYCEVAGDQIEAFVRDRGEGFELHAVPLDRRGVRDSILGRMDRAGGSAEIKTGPGTGTEVRLSLSS